MMPNTPALFVILAGMFVAGSAPISAQARRPTPPPTSPTVTVRAFADVGRETFAAAQSFRTIFGSASALVVGGGVSLVERHGAFGEIRFSRFRATGERVFVTNGQVFPLGIANDVTLTPIELTGGFRWVRPGWRAVPYVGAGIGWHRYTESSLAASTGDDVSQTFTGFHLTGGAEVPLSRWIAVAGDVHWSRVPDALGGPNSVGRELGETGLGGSTVRARIIVGPRP